MMMVAMEDVHDFLASFTGCFQMENKPVRYILKESPEENPAHKQQEYLEHGIVKWCMAIVQHVDDEG